jgi:hypothetical protein
MDILLFVDDNTIQYNTCMHADGETLNMSTSEMHIVVPRIGIAHTYKHKVFYFPIAKMLPDR